MKTSIKFLALLLSTLALSGCASTKCKCNTPAAEPVAVASAVTAPAEPVVAPKTAPVQEEPATEAIPAATRKYVSK